MDYGHRLSIAVRSGLMFVVLCCHHGQAQSTAAAPAPVTLQDANAARTEIAALHQTVVDNVITPLASEPAAAKLYRQSLDWRTLQATVTKATRAVTTARLLANAAVGTAPFRAARQLQVNADNLFAAGEFPAALTAFTNARAVFRRLDSRRCPRHQGTS